MLVNGLDLYMVWPSGLADRERGMKLRVNSFVTRVSTHHINDLTRSIDV